MFSSCLDVGRADGGIVNVVTKSGTNSFHGTAYEFNRGPGYWNINLLLAKTFKLNERFSMQFRGELYNTFNHHNLYVDGYNLDVSSMGTPFVTAGKGGFGPATDERRNVQFALKLIF